MIGYNYFVNADIVWRENQKTLMPISSMKSVEFTSEDAKRLLKDSRLLLVRWETNFDSEIDSGWWHVIKSQPEDINNYVKKVRYEIRKGLKNFETKRVSRETIVEDGYEVYKLAYNRYETHEEMYSLTKFKEEVINLPPETEFFGSFDSEGRLVGFSENYISSNTCFYVSMWFTSEALKLSASYTMFHVMNQYYLNELSFDYVSDGARSLSHDTNIHGFLISKFGFRKSFCRLNVEYNFLVKVLLFVAKPFSSIINSTHIDFFQKISVLLKLDSLRCKN